MTGDEVRELAAALRQVSVDQAAAHAAHARLLAGTLTPSESIAVKALAAVADCMSRRYRQWASHLEVAANEIDELT